MLPTQGQSMVLMNSPAHCHQARAWWLHHWNALSHSVANYMVGCFDFGKTLLAWLRDIYRFVVAWPSSPNLKHSGPEWPIERWKYGFARLGRLRTFGQKKIRTSRKRYNRQLCKNFCNEWRLRSIFEKNAKKKKSTGKIAENRRCAAGHALKLS